ncbi:hypothetical protein [Embleya sp. NPDC005971]|uniref:hypothetical protein n=1 Tax=Embleya sp. NPDC005971 TaxID=3156724 RepID=UPI0033F4CAA6
MKVFFQDADLAMACNDDTARRKRFGPDLSSTIRRRLGEIVAVAHLGELHRIPAARPRRHPGRDDGCLLVALGSTADLVVLPRGDPPSSPDGHSHDESTIRSLVVVSINLA